MRGQTETIAKATVDLAQFASLAGSGQDAEVAFESKGRKLGVLRLRVLSRFKNASADAADMSDGSVSHSDSESEAESDREDGDAPSRARVSSMGGIPKTRNRHQKEAEREPTTPPRSQSPPAQPLSPPSSPGSSALAPELTSMSKEELVRLVMRERSERRKQLQSREQHVAHLEKRMVELLKQLDQVEAQKVDIESENDRLRVATKGHENVLLKQLDGYESGGFVRASVTAAVLNDMDPRNVYYIYEVTVEIGPFRYALPRRYKQFAKVHDDLTGSWKQGMKTLPDFPPTTYFKNVSPQFAEHRRTALSNWLEALTSGDRPDQVAPLITRDMLLDPHTVLLTLWPCVVTRNP